jgi:hypothetical protein
MKKLPTYIVVNLTLLLVASIFSFYFTLPGSWRLPCLIREFTGMPCVTCGFTRAFQSFLQFDFEAGRAFNELALPLFWFLAGQVLLRILIVASYYFFRHHLKPQVIKLEVLASISVFLLAFLPVLISI